MRIFESLHSDFKRSIVVVRAVVDVTRKRRGWKHAVKKTGQHIKSDRAVT